MDLMPSAKKHKENHLPDCNEKPDKISNLPDGILCHILSLLPTRCAEQTSVLSKRWKNLWALLPDLELQMPVNLTFNYEETFMNFVEKTLILRNSLPVRTFLLSCSPSTTNYNPVYDYVCTVLNCRVEELDLHLPKAMYAVKLPWNHFMNCKTLVRLSLGTQFVVHIPIDVLFPCLKCLDLISLIYFDEASIGRLFSGCPVLEELFIQREMDDVSDNIPSLKVSVPSLKRLELWNIKGVDIVYELMLDAPNLEGLCIFDQISENYAFKNLSSIDEAHVYVDLPLRNRDLVAHGGRVLGLLRSISAVKTLKLCEPTMTLLGFAHNNIPATFHNVVHLSLEIDVIHGWLLLSSFLQSMPNLEELVFAKGFVPVRHWRRESNLVWRTADGFKFNWHPPEVVPACLVSKLHTIEIRNYEPLTKIELKFIKYLLANAMCLKIMKMSRRKIDQKIRMRLSRFHRGSDSCQLLLVPYSSFLKNQVR